MYFNQYTMISGSVINFKPGHSIWLKIVDLLFVDNLVARGLDFVKDTKLFAETDEEAAERLIKYVEPEPSKVSYFIIN